MGAYGSGSRATIQSTASYRLGADVLRGMRPGDRRALRLTWPDGFTIEARVCIEAERYGWAELRHDSHVFHGEVEPMTYRVHIARTTPTYGGRRYWWICPRSGRRCGALYLPLGGYKFWSRQAYRLDYASQRETLADRMMRKARKLRVRLGADPCEAALPDKPRWMRWATYDRLAEQIEVAEALADEALCIQAGRLLGWR